MPYFDGAGGVRLFYTDWGEGEPLVFAHAWGLNGEMWSYQIPDLTAAGLRCITYDRRGHGRSDRPGTGYDLDTLADDLAALVEHLDLTGVTLVGHSMGAAEAVRYVTRHGAARLSALVLSAPTTPCLAKSGDNPDGIPQETLEAIRAALSSDVAQWLSGSSGYFGERSADYQGMSTWTARQILDTPLQILLETNRTFTRADLRVELQALALPTLVIQGTADVSAPIELTGRRTAALIPDARLVELAGAGHGLYFSEARRWNREVADFVRR